MVTKASAFGCMVLKQQPGRQCAEVGPACYIQHAVPQQQRAAGAGSIRRCGWLDTIWGPVLTAAAAGVQSLDLLAASGLDCWLPVPLLDILLTALCRSCRRSL